MLIENYLCPCNKHCAINTPGQSEGLSSNLKFRGACLATSIPEPDKAITGAACKLELSGRIEQNLLDGMCVTSELNLALWNRSFRIPDADRSIGGSSRYQRTGSIP